MSYMDNCTACEEKDRDLEFAYCQLDCIRELIDDVKKMTDIDCLRDAVMEILER